MMRSDKFVPSKTVKVKVTKVHVITTNGYFFQLFSF